MPARAYNIKTCDSGACKQTLSLHAMTEMASTIDCLLDVLLERVFTFLESESRSAAKLCCKRWCSIINASTKLLTRVHIHEPDQVPSVLRWLRCHPHNAIDTLDLHCHFPLCDLGTEMYAVLEAIQPGQLQVLVADVDRIAAAPWDRFMKLRVLKVRVLLLASIPTSLFSSSCPGAQHAQRTTIPHASRPTPFPGGPALPQRQPRQCQRAPPPSSHPAWDPAMPGLAL